MKKNYAISAFFALTLALSINLGLALNGTLAQADAKSKPRSKANHDAPPKPAGPARDGNDSTPEKTDNNADKKSSKSVEVPIENVVNVTVDQLVEKPHDYLYKNVKFTAKFASFSTLALDYKPALRTSKTHLSFLVLRPESHVPYSELKLAMAIPKEKDPENQVLTSLKDGDPIEMVAKVFATSLDEPWVEVLRLKRLTPPAEEKTDKKASASDTESGSTTKKAKPEEHPTH